MLVLDASKIVDDNHSIRTCDEERTGINSYIILFFVIGDVFDNLIRAGVCNLFKAQVMISKSDYLLLKSQT